MMRPKAAMCASADAYLRRAPRYASGDRGVSDEKRLVPSCCVIFELEPLSLSVDFVFSSEIFKSFLLEIFVIVCHLAILYVDRHAHTMHHLESLLTISLDTLCLDNLDIFKEDLEYQCLRKTL
ncbi:hypothetical protein Tco_0195377, partial [Tanacetum coccineum]